MSSEGKPKKFSDLFNKAAKALDDYLAKGIDALIGPIEEPVQKAQEKKRAITHRVKKFHI